MYNVLNIFFFILILFFSLAVYQYYSSSKNLESRVFNRNNIDQIIKDKTLDLPTLNNDTNNVILFNDSFSNEAGNDKPRSFWNLLKSK